MKIIWNPNPLRTTVEIDNADRERILLQIQNNRYLDIITDLEEKIENSKINSISEVTTALAEWETVCDMDIHHERVTTYVEHLRSEHEGDCTCIPCSCIKCHAESALSIDTLQGLGKHEANRIKSAFGKAGDQSIDEAIESLRKIPDYGKPKDWPKHVEYEKHVFRWEHERETALSWLLEYKEIRRF